MEREKELFKELSDLTDDMDKILRASDYTPRFVVLEKIFHVIKRLLYNRECMKCKTILDDSHISCIIFPEMEDPVKTITYVCPNCGCEILKQYDDDDEGGDE